MNLIDDLLSLPLETKPELGSTTGGRDWAGPLCALHASLTQPASRSSWSIEWGIHRWASDTLESTAIRIRNSEGLSGPPPARWRVLVHLDATTLGFALVILDGRAPLAPANVEAALVDDGSSRAAVAARGAGLRPLEAHGAGEPSPEIAALLDELDKPIRRRADQLDSASLPDELRLALALFRAERSRG